MREAIRICNENVYINFKHNKTIEIKFHHRVGPFFFKPIKLLIFDKFIVFYPHDRKIYVWNLQNISKYI